MGETQVLYPFAQRSRRVCFALPLRKGYKILHPRDMLQKSHNIDIGIFYIWVEAIFQKYFLDPGEGRVKHLNINIRVLPIGYPPSG